MNNKILFMIAYGLVTLFLSACEQTDYLPCVRPSGSAVEESRIAESFSEINVYMHANVYISKGEQHSITIVAAPNILEHIEVRSTGQTLFVDNNRCLRTRTDDINIFITTPEIEKLGLSGSGNIFLDKGFEGEHLRLSLSGSGKILAEGIIFQRVDTHLSGSGSIQTSGYTLQQNVSISGSGKADSYFLESKKTSVKVSGSGSAKVFVTEYLDGRITGSGKIWYIGNPTVNVSIAGSGTIHHVEQEFHFVKN
ncbi:MAG: DUF2807 domain-containing protein [Bacteroidetes bacterium]|nr:MAG: DUF2807 domain-containing protein [Bacteroidota bacterium]